MLKLGEIVNTEKMGATKNLWLVKDLRVENKKESYAVMGRRLGSGWYFLNHGTLKEMRNYIKNNI